MPSKASNPAAELRAALTPAAHCEHHPELRRSDSPEAAQLWWESIQLCSPTKRHEHLRWLARNDLFFLLVYILNRRHFIADERKTAWTFARCNEVQDDPDNHLDIWPREHFKSEVITFGLTIQEILKDPELTFGVFSHTRPMAKDFLVVIKREFENNELLKSLFPDILWADPKLDARAASMPWSEEEITVKRKGNPKESTIEAWGLTDGQPTGKRYKRLIYDDVVSRNYISEDMIRKTTIEFNNSLLLTSSDPPVFRYVATFQEIDDTTQALIDKRLGILRKHECLIDGIPVCFSDDKFAWFKQNLLPKVFALQVLLDPTKAKDEADAGFDIEWLTDQYYDEMPPRQTMNVYVLVDPAGRGIDSNSHFALIVVGLCADKGARILDIVWDKLDLEERWQAVFDAVQKWEPLKVGYEKYGMQSDIEHFHFRMKQLNISFPIIQLSDPTLKKDQRIGLLIPWFRDKRIWLPRKMKKQLKDGQVVDLVHEFVHNEFSMWPFKKQKDMLDALARIADPALAVVWPRRYGAAGYASGAGAISQGMGWGGGGWMSE